MHVSWHLTTPFCSHIYSITFFSVTILYFVYNFTFTKKYVELNYFLKLRGICSNCFYSNVLLVQVCIPLRGTLFFVHIFQVHVCWYILRNESLWIIGMYMCECMCLYIYIYIYINTHALNFTSSSSLNKMHGILEFEN